MHELPEDIKKRILSYLPAKDINSIAFVCKELFNLTFSEREKKVHSAMRPRLYRLQKKIAGCQADLNLLGRSLFKLYFGVFLFMALSRLGYYMLHRDQDNLSTALSSLAGVLLAVVFICIVIPKSESKIKSEIISRLKNLKKEEKQLEKRLQTNTMNVLTFLEQRATHGESSRKEPASHLKKRD